MDDQGSETGATNPGQSGRSTGGETGGQGRSDHQVASQYPRRQTPQPSYDPRENPGYDDQGQEGGRRGGSNRNRGEQGGRQSSADDMDDYDRNRRGGRRSRNEQGQFSRQSSDDGGTNDHLCEAYYGNPGRHDSVDHYHHQIEDPRRWQYVHQPRYRFAHEHMQGMEDHQQPFGRQPQPWYTQEGMPRYQYGHSDYGMYATPPWVAPYENPGHGQGRSNPQGREQQNMSGDTDKVSVNLGAGGFGPLTGGYGGSGGGDGSNAALLALLMSGHGRDRDHGGVFGGDGIGGLLALALLGGGGGFGGFGRGHGDHVNVDCGGRHGGHDHDGGLFVLSKLGSIEGAVPLAASQIQNAILEATAGITNTVNQTGLAQLAATSGVKDAVQNSATAILQNASNNTQSVLSAICTLSAKIDHNQIADLQRQLTVAQSDIAEERFNRRSRDVEVNVTQQVNQQQQQQQFQVQFQDLARRFEVMCGQFQNIRQAQDIVNLGTMVASGTQASTNTQVR